MPRQTDLRTDRVSKRVKKPVTVESLLTQDNAKNAVGNILEVQSNITDMVCVYRDRDGNTNWIVTRESLLSLIIYMLEQTKICLLTQEVDE